MIRIEVKARQVYGETKLYPANEAAETLARIAGTKTLTTETLALAKRMGCIVALNAAVTLSELVA